MFLGILEDCPLGWEYENILSNDSLNLLGVDTISAHVKACDPVLWKYSRRSKNSPSTHSMACDKGKHVDNLKKMHLHFDWNIWNRRSTIFLQDRFFI